MTKEDLKKIIELNKLIDSKLRQLEQLKNLQYGLKAVNQDLTGVHGSGISNTTESAAIKIVSLSEEINADIDKLVDVKNEAKGFIEQLDFKYRLVMELRYMECLSWAEIERISGYTNRHIYRIHGQALKLLKKCH